MSDAIDQLLYGTDSEPEIEESGSSGDDFRRLSKEELEYKVISEVSDAYFRVQDILEEYNIRLNNLGAFELYILKSLFSSGVVSHRRSVLEYINRINFNSFPIPNPETTMYLLEASYQEFTRNFRYSSISFNEFSKLFLSGLIF